MFPHHVAEELKKWLVNANHAGITQVRTCEEVGRWEQPVGVMLDLSDGWRFVLQCVGTAPDGGDVNRDPNYSPPDLPAGMWDEMPIYRANRKKFEAEMAGYDGPKSRRPQAPPRALMTVALDLIKDAGHDGIASADIRDGRPTIRVTCADGAKVYCLAAGYLAPGEAKLAHPAHDIPADWSKEVARVS